MNKNLQTSKPHENKSVFDCLKIIYCKLGSFLLHNIFLVSIQGKDFYSSMNKELYWPMSDPCSYQYCYFFHLYKNKIFFHCLTTNLKRKRRHFSPAYLRLQSLHLAFKYCKLFNINFHHHNKICTKFVENRSILSYFRACIINLTQVRCFLAVFVTPHTKFFAKKYKF